jgi:hypothetical protein
MNQLLADVLPEKSLAIIASADQQMMTDVVPWSCTEYRKKLRKELLTQHNLVSANLKTEYYQINIRSLQSSDTKQSSPKAISRTHMASYKQITVKPTARTLQKLSPAVQSTLCVGLI